MYVCARHGTRVSRVLARAEHMWLVGEQDAPSVDGTVPFPSHFGLCGNEAAMWLVGEEDAPSVDGSNTIRHTPYVS